MKRKWIKLEKVDHFLLGALAIILIVHYSRLVPYFTDRIILIFFASVATLPVFYSTYLSLKSRKITVDLLAGVALVASLLTQQWASAVFINLMLTSARLFDSYTQNRARKAIKSLMKLRPEKVKIKKEKDIVEVAVSEIRKGDLIIVELGERVPVDGIVVSGISQLDQSSLTGESLPVEKKEGDEVLSSTMNISGSLIIRAEKIGEDTTFEKIIKLVEESQKDKASIQTTADKFTTWYISLTLLGAVLVYSFTLDLRLVLSVLLVTCADDIAVAIPIAFSAGIARAAKKGIIIKGGSFLEGLARVKTIIIDKTGTLTKGMLKVEKIYTFNDKSEKEVVSLAASADFFSTHPIAHAIIRYAKDQKITFVKVEKFEEKSGMGSYAIFKGKKIICGKLDFLQNSGVEISSDQMIRIKKIKTEDGGSVLPVAYGKDLIGLIVLEDEIRPEAKSVIEKWKELGIKNIIMLTGDNENVAKKVSDSVGITVYHADLLPGDKIEYIKKYLNAKNKVAMIGDGVNDAAALTLADVGIAMGALGTDSAIEAADIVLMKDNLSEVSEAIELGQCVNVISHQDFWVWGSVNIIGLFLVFAKIIGPEGAAAFNFITDFFPLINSMRVFRYRLSDKHFFNK